MKYAFDGMAEGHILVSVKLGSGRVTLIVQDDGKGIPETVDIGCSTGFGLMLVKELTKQLNGNVRIERVGGTRIILEFEL
jgi:two-component sensor histidine kinase